MADRINDGGPAFPSEYFDRHLFADARETEGVLRAKDAATVNAPGMSLRDYFAAVALTGLLAHASGEDPDVAPARAYKLADAMLKAREVQP